MSDRDTQDQQGIGLVEIVVAMLLFGILMAAMAPLVLSSVQVTAKMTTVATANQLVVDGIDTLRVEIGGSAAKCQTILSANPQVTSSHEDQRGIALQRVLYLSGTCAKESLLTVRSVVRADSSSYFFDENQIVSEASQRIFLGSD